MDAAGGAYCRGRCAGGGDGELHAAIALGTGEDGLEGRSAAVESVGTTGDEEEHEGKADEGDAGVHVVGYLV